MAAARPGHDVRTVVTAERARRRLIAVASGKGGVGKSTLSANLAIALARGGRRTGLVDADIYGPSQPRLMAVEGTRPEARDKVLLPVATPYGVPLLSMGQLVEPGRAIAWRGPMTAGALGQLIDADWGLTDTLVVDLPPGTGDVQLTMVQKHRPAGAVIVSTPQDLALIDARRAIDLFQKAGVPIIGLVENMAGYICPHCGEVSDPFGRGGAEAAAREAGIAFLGRVPLDLAIRIASDAGEPPAARDDDRVFAPIAAQVAAWLAAN
ncbi:Mrp/NBP35 family ATP-binding protein [Sphingomonas sp. RHCKR7]|nr:Mrp/NBP35 family ATP-binding protein [Sphingomonas folli]